MSNLAEFEEELENLEFCDLPSPGRLEILRNRRRTNRSIRSLRRFFLGQKIKICREQSIDNTEDRVVVTVIAEQPIRISDTAKFQRILEHTESFQFYVDDGKNVALAFEFDNTRSAAFQTKPDRAGSNMDVDEKLSRLYEICKSSESLNETTTGYMETEEYGPAIIYNLYLKDTCFYAVNDGDEPFYLSIRCADSITFALEDSEVCLTMSVVCENDQVQCR